MLPKALALGPARVHCVVGTKHMKILIALVAALVAMNCLADEESSALDRKIIGLLLAACRMRRCHTRS